MAKLDVIVYFEVYDLNVVSKEEHWAIVSVADQSGVGVAGLAKKNFKAGVMWKVGMMGLTVDKVVAGSLPGYYALRLIITGSTTSAFGVEETFVGVAVTSGSDSGQGLGFNPYVCCGGSGGGGTTFKPDAKKARGAKAAPRPRGTRRARR
jgi:hypothetical protein